MLSTILRILFRIPYGMLPDGNWEGDKWKRLPPPTGTGRRSRPSGSTKESVVRGRSLYDPLGWGQEGIHPATGTPFNPDGFSQRGLHWKTGTRYNPEGFDRDGKPKEALEEDTPGHSSQAARPGGSGRLENPEGLDQDDHAAGAIADWHEEDVLSPDRWDDRGFSQDGFHRKTGTGYDPDGFDFQGYDFEGYDRRGYDSLGYDREGYDREGYDFQGYNRRGSRRRD